MFDAGASFRLSSAIVAEIPRKTKEDEVKEEGKLEKPQQNAVDASFFRFYN